LIHHTVLLRWKPTTSAARQAELAAELVALRHVIPEIRSITTGPNLDPTSAGEWPFILEVQVDDLAALKRYVEHPAHVAVANALKEAREARLAVDLEV
jgi:hypothetical protein